MLTCNWLIVISDKLIDKYFKFSVLTSSMANIDRYNRHEQKRSSRQSVIFKSVKGP